MKIMTSESRHDARPSCPTRIESAPRLGADGALLDDGELGGQRAGAEQHGEVVGRCTVKLPLIWPVPPRIGSRITGAEITLLSSTMAKGRPTFSWVTLPKRLAPAASKRKVTTGSPVRLSKPGCASTRFCAA